MQLVDIHEVETHFFHFVDIVIEGEEIIVTKAGKPAARLCPLPQKPKLRLGLLKGKIKISDDFDAPLPEEILKEFEGN